MNENYHTFCVHPIKHESFKNDSITAGIFPSTSYKYFSEGEMIYPGFFSTYNQKRLGDIMARHEGGAQGLIFNSGMSAISTALLTFLRKDDHIIASRALYGGTMRLITDELGKMGVSVSFFGDTIQNFEQLIQENTKVILIETPSNPLLSILPLADIAKLASLRGIITIADNTLASSINQRPLEHGFDISIQSGTKYLGGHNDLQFGTLVVRDKSLVDKILPVANLYGGALSPEDCYRAERGLKTLALRVHQQNKNAAAVASFLGTHELIGKVYYPGIMGSPGFETARSQMDGFGGVLSFELTVDSSGIEIFLRALSMITPALSFGGVESVICIPARTSHSSIPPDMRKKLGINNNLLRLSAGIEASADIIDDLKSALLVLSDNISANKAAVGTTVTA